MKDAKRAHVDFSTIEDPKLDGDEGVVAAALVELFAQRQGKTPPAWTRCVGRASTPRFLMRRADASPAMRRWCLEDTPDVLRRRNVFALRDYLNVL